MVQWRSAFLKILCGILMLQLSFPENFAFANDGDGEEGIQFTRPSTDLGGGRHIPADVVAILQKIQLCSELPVCSDPNVPTESLGTLRMNLPAQCRLTPEEQTRLQSYYNSLRLRDSQIADALGMAVVVYLIVGLSSGFFLVNHLRSHYDLHSTAGPIGIVYATMVITILTTMGFANLVDRNFISGGVTPEQFNRTIQGLGVDPRNVEQALARIPRRSWIRAVISSTGRSLSHGARRIRLRNALLRFLHRNTSAPNAVAVNTAIAPAAPQTGVPAEAASRTQSTDGNSAEGGTPPTGVRVCVPRSEVVAAGDALADETLDFLEGGATAGDRGRGTRRTQVEASTQTQAVSGSSDVPSPVTVQPSPPPRRRRPVIQDLRPPHPGAYRDAVHFSGEALSESPALVPGAAPAGAAAGATDALVPGLAR